MRSMSKNEGRPRAVKVILQEMLSLGFRLPWFGITVTNCGVREGKRSPRVSFWEFE